MTDLLDIGPDDAVLEIGTGLGYQSAILAQLARKVYSIEIIEELGRTPMRGSILIRTVRHIGAKLDLNTVS